MAKAKSSGKGKKVKAVGTEERKVLHPEPRAEIRMGERAFTVDDCMKMLGWTKVDKGEFHFVDNNGKKILCTNNLNNRPLYMSNVEKLVQEHLRKRWEFNGETIIIGETGRILNGQHSLISVPLAEQIRLKQPTRWEAWSSPITMEKAIIYGVSERDEVVDTMDTAKPRSLDEVVYRSRFLKDEKAKDRRAIARLVKAAMLMIWNRIGYSEMQFSPDKKTHTEMMAFLSVHETIVKAAKHIYEENAEGRINHYLSPGYAAGLLFLMASSESDPDVYANAEQPNEALLDMGMWDKACDFWVLVSKGDPKLSAVRDAFASYINPETGSISISREERVAMLCRAWERFAKDKSIEGKHLALNYIDDDDIRILDDDTTAGGIDQGEPKAQRAARKDMEDEAAEAAEMEDDDLGVSEEEEEEAAEEEQETKRPPRPKTKPSGELARIRKEPENFEQEFNQLKEEHKGAPILFKQGDDYVAYGTDAVDISRLLKTGLGKSPHGQRTVIPGKKLEAAKEKVRKLVIVEDAKQLPPLK